MYIFERNSIVSGNFFFYCLFRFLPHQRRPSSTQRQYPQWSCECLDFEVGPNLVWYLHVSNPKVSLLHLGVATVPSIEEHPKSLKKGMYQNSFRYYICMFGRGKYVSTLPDTFVGVSSFAFLNGSGAGGVCCAHFTIKLQLYGSIGFVSLWLLSSHNILIIMNDSHKFLVRVEFSSFFTLLLDKQSSPEMSNWL